VRCLKAREQQSALKRVAGLPIEALTVIGQPRSGRSKRLGRQRRGHIPCERRPRDAYLGAAALKQLGAEVNAGALCKAAAAALAPEAPALEDTYYAAELLALAGCAAALSGAASCALRSARRLL
jgi:hypothetical protein